MSTNRQWSTIDAPVWAPNAIQSPQGWIDPDTGEILVAIARLSVRGDADGAGTAVEGQAIITSIKQSPTTLNYDVSAGTYNTDSITYDVVFNEKIYFYDSSDDIIDTTAEAFDFSDVVLTLNFGGSEVELDCIGYATTKKGKVKENTLQFEYPLATALSLTIDDWAPTTYSVNDLVNYGNSIYRCIQEITSETENPQGPDILGDNEFWVVEYDVTSPIALTAEWDAAATEYDVGAFVLDTTNNNVYVNTTGATTTGTEPSADSTNWSIYLDTGTTYDTEWDAETEYTTGNYARIGADVYVCLVASSTGENPTGETQTDWKYLFNWSDFVDTIDDWEAGTYDAYDVVRYSDDNIYISDIDTNSSDPDNPANWTLLIEVTPDSFSITDFAAAKVNYTTGDFAEYNDVVYTFVEGGSQSIVPTDDSFAADTWLVTTSTTDILIDEDEVVKVETSATAVDVDSIKDADAGIVAMQAHINVGDTAVYTSYTAPADYTVTTNFV